RSCAAGCRGRGANFAPWSLHIVMRGLVTTLDRNLARIASRQHGVVTRQQLIGLGFSTAAIERRVRAGSLIPQYRGVYRVGHQAPSTEARYMAAVLAAGDGAVMSGRAAAHLHRLLRGGTPAAEVTAARKVRIRGVKTRRVRLHSAE